MLVDTVHDRLAALGVSSSWGRPSGHTGDTTARMGTLTTRDSRLALYCSSGCRLPKMRWGPFAGAAQRAPLAMTRMTSGLW